MGLSAKDLSRLGPAARKQIAQQYGDQRESKYHNQTARIVNTDGETITFDSNKEAERYAELAMLQMAGEISDLRRQVPYELIPKQRRADGKAERAVIYYADFVYKDKTGKTIVEDVKGYKTKEYIIKRKLMLDRFGITVKEI